MTVEDNLDSLRDGVASEVMGWTVAARQWAYSDTAMVWHDADGAPVLTCFAWRPDENDLQNMQVLDRMSSLGYDYVIRASAGSVAVSFVRGASCQQAATHEDRRVAVLLAALAALR